MTISVIIDPQAGIQIAEENKKEQTIIIKMSKCSNIQGPSQLRKITEHDEDADQLDSEQQMVLETQCQQVRQKLGEEEEGQETKQRKNSKIRTCWSLNHGGLSALVMGYKPKIRIQSPMIFDAPLKEEVPPTMILPLQEQSSLTPQLNGQSQLALIDNQTNKLIKDDHSIKKKLRTTNTNRANQTFDTFSSFTPIQIPPSLKLNNLSVSQAKKVTNFGASAIEFKNSFIKDKMRSSRGLQMKHSQQMERKTMPVRAPLTATTTATATTIALIAPINPQTQTYNLQQPKQKKLIKIKAKIQINKSKYQTSQQVCCPYGCLTPYIEDVKERGQGQKQQQNWMKFDDIEMNFNRERSMSEQIKQSLASTNYKAASQSEDRDDEQERKIWPTVESVMRTSESLKFNSSRTPTHKNGINYYAMVQRN